jgi:hypothetical protein
MPGIPQIAAMTQEIVTTAVQQAAGRTGRRARQRQMPGA